MSSGSSRIYNLISIVFLLLSVAACIVVLWLLLSAAPVEQGAAFEVPTIAVALLPTLTPSATATATDLPTFTPTATQTLVPSITPVPSETPIPPTATFTPSPTLTITPSQTITNTPGPTPTDLPTETPTNTDVPTALPSPTGPTPSPYPFDVRGGAPSFTINFANSAGCSFQGIGGQVFDVNNQPLNGIRIHVLGQNFDNYSLSGSNTFYGAGGWEIALATTVSTTTYIVQLETEAGTIISPQVTVAFPGDCNRNLALVNFIQTRPY